MRKDAIKKYVNTFLMKGIVFLWYVVVKASSRKMHKVCGRWLGGLFLKLPIRKREVAKKNIQLCFPEYSKKNRHELLKENAKMVGRALFDVGISWFWTDEQIRRNCHYRIEGGHILAKKNGKQGTLLLFKHSLHFMLDARILGLDYEIYGVTRDVKNSNFINDLYMQKRMHACKGIALPHEPLKFIRWLKKGKILCYAMDHDYGLENSIIANFFNAPAATITAPFKMRKMTNCRICLLDSYYDKEDVLVLRITEQDGLDDSCQHSFLQKLNDLTAGQIARKPQEYHWYYGRFKSMNVYKKQAIQKN